MCVIESHNLKEKHEHLQLIFLLNKHHSNTQEHILQKNSTAKSLKHKK